MIIILAYVLSAFTSTTSGRVNFNSRQNDPSKIRENFMKDFSSRSMRMKSISLESDDSENESELESKSTDDPNRYFYDKPVRDKGFITDEQEKKLFYIFQIYGALWYKILLFKDEDLRNTFQQIYKTLEDSAIKMVSSRNLENWRYLRINRVLSRLNRLFEFLETLIFNVERYQNQDRKISRLEDYLNSLQKNVFDRLYK